MKKSNPNYFFRLGLIELIFALAMVTANLSSSFIFKAVGYTGVFAITSLLTTLSTLYAIFILPESVENTEQEVSLCVIESIYIVIVIYTVLTQYEINSNLRQHTVFEIISIRNMINFLLIIFIKK